MLNYDTSCPLCMSTIAVMNIDSMVTVGEVDFCFFQSPLCLHLMAHMRA